MKRYHHRLSAAALTLIVCLAITPTAAAAPLNLGDHEFVRRVVQIFKNIQKKFSITSLQDFPGPPKP